MSSLLCALYQGGAKNSLKDIWTKNSTIIFLRMLSDVSDSSCKIHCSKMNVFSKKCLLLAHNEVYAALAVLGCREVVY